MNRCMDRVWISVLFIFFVLCTKSSFAEDKKPHGLLYPELVSKFYAAHQQLFWMGRSVGAVEMRRLLLQRIDSAVYIGTERTRYGFDRLQGADSQHGSDSNSLMKLDMLFTDAAIAYCKDLYQGYGISIWMKYDEWSVKYADRDNDFIIGHLAAIRSAGELAGFLQALEPTSGEYSAYKTELAVQYQNNQTAKAKRVATAMNFYRWIHHFSFERYIVVNIPSVSLKYFNYDSVVLFSRMIVGKPSTRTPRFNATCKDVILYPYWNVPTDIALKELVPKYKRSPGLVDKENMQILDAKGNVISPYSIDWSKYSSRYFPYRLRQSTGCDNSLGIIKFDLTSPFGVYLHDTNTRGLFESLKRFRSHGCMRVEKAIQLGNLLLNNKLDTAFLQACIKGEKPITLQLEKPVPVFVVYLTAEANDSGVVSYYDDVYRLLPISEN